MNLKTGMSLYFVILPKHFNTLFEIIIWYLYYRILPPFFRNPQTIIDQRVVLTGQLENVKEMITHLEGKLKTAHHDYQQKEVEIQRVNDNYQSSRYFVNSVMETVDIL